MVYNLSLQGNAPKQFKQLSIKGIPSTAIIFSIICIAFTVWLNYLYPKQIFNILLAVATIAAIINWITILITHACFKRKFKGESSYKTILYPLSSIIAIAFLVMVAIIMYFMPSFKMAIIIAPIWLALLSLAYFCKLKFGGSQHAR